MHITRLLSTLLIALACAFTAAHAEMNYVDLNFRPAVYINLGEYGQSSKEVAESAKKMKKQYKATRIELHQWTDNSINLAVYFKPKKRSQTDILLGRTPKEEFMVRRPDGRELFGGNAITNAETASVDGKLLYHGYNTNTNRHYLETDEGKRILTSDGSIALLDDGEEKIWFTMSGTNPAFYNYEGGTIFWIGGTSTQIESTPAIAGGIKEVIVGGEKVSMYSPAYPKYFYAQTSDNYDYIHLATRDGERVGMIDPERDNFFPTPGAGYIISSYDPDIDYYTQKRYTEFGGEMVQLNEIVTTAGGQPLKIKGADTKEILSDASDIAYNTDSHSITYNDYGRTREANQGAIFLRDSTLNIPPHFYEAGYRFNASTEKWEPWVRRKLYAKSEPYVPGMEETPVTYADEGEKMVNEGKYYEALYNYYMKLPEDHKFTKDELSLINFAAIGGGITQLEQAHYEGLLSPTPDLAVRSYRLALDVINKNMHLYTTGYASQLYDRAIASPANKDVAAYAKSLKADLADTKSKLTTWGDAIKAHKEQLIAEYEEANRASTPSASTYTRTLPVASSAATTSSVSGANSNSAANAALAAAVAGMVSRTISRAMGIGASRGNGFTVTYTPGASSVGAGTGVISDASTGSSSSGASVKTAQKCTHCTSGECQACKNHPGFATAGDSTHKCKVCGGNARCSYCGGSGYRSL